jgi:nucleoside-diphosphate-sugar epimerase
MRALVIGGTGPTGPHVVRGLRDRGYDVTIFHRGTHEPEGMQDCRHIHGDPHFKDTIVEALGADSYDVVLAMYGRVRFIAEVLAGRCGHFLAVGGVPAYAGYNEPGRVRPSGLPVPVREDSPLIDTVPGEDEPSIRFGQLMLATERTVLEHHPRATYFRYPVIYGPRNPAPWEWSVIKRMRDGRPFIILPDSGMAIHSRCAARNAAEFLLLAIDHPGKAAGRTYNVADDDQFTLRQWAEVIIDSGSGGAPELLGIPSDIARTAQAAMMPMVTPLSAHSILDTSRARAELGYRDVIPPAEAIAESVRWYLAHPVDLSTVNPAYVDRFDYQAEDKLAAAYRSMVRDITEAVPQPVPASLHGMPHPKQPGLAADHKAR